MTTLTAHAPASAPSAQSPDGASQYLTFVCAGEEYGIDILRVQEIKSWGGVTPLPEAPPHVLGVMNLRGEIVPVVDLRARFGLEPRTMAEGSCLRPLATVENNMVILLNIDLLVGAAVSANIGVNAHG